MSQPLGPSRTWRELLDAADGVEFDLEVPFAEVLGDLDLSVRGHHLLQTWCLAEPRMTVDDLLSEELVPPFSMPASVKVEVHEALRDWIKRQRALRELEASAPLTLQAADPLPKDLTSASLDAWARARHMQPYLAASLERIAPFVTTKVSGAWRWRTWTPVGVTLLAPSKGRDALPAAERTALRSALESIASQIDAATREEATHHRVGPTDPSLAALWARWSDLRTSLRRDAHPVRAALRAGYEVAVQADPPVLHIHAPPAIQCRSRTVRVSLGLESTIPQMPCDCGGNPPSCPARLAAVDRALDELADPNSRVADQIAAALATPPWARALARLERATAAPKTIEPIGWRLKVSEHGATVEPVTFRQAKNGHGLVLTHASEAAVQSAGHEQDLRALEELKTANTYGFRPEVRDSCTRRAIRHLAGHPNVFLGKQQAAIVEEPWVVEINGAESGATVSIRHDGRRSTVREYLASFAGEVVASLGLRVDLERLRVAVVPLPPAAWTVLQAVRDTPPCFPPEAVGRLVDMTDRWRGAMSVELTGTLRGVAIAPSTRLEARLGIPAPGVLRVSLRVRPLPGGEALPPGDGAPELSGMVDGQRVVTTRDLDAERALHRRAWAELPGEAASAIDLLDPEIALPWLERVASIPEVDITWEGARRWSVRPSVSAKDVRLTGRDARSWFAVDGVVQVDRDTIPLSTLLAAVRERRTYVPVGADRWARLTDSLRGQIDTLARGNQTADDTLDLSLVHLPMIEALVQDGASLDGSARLFDLLERLRTADTADIHVPTGLRAQLRPYQEEGYRFLARLARWAPGALLADDMGLGKTVQTLALLLDRAALGPTLVVAPTSVGFNWLREAATFAPSLRVEAWRGSDRKARLATLTPGDVLVTSYDLVQRDAKALADVEFATVVLDEAQAVKNATTLRWKAVHGLKRAFTVALTGTPMENRIDELWSLATLVTPGLFGSAKEFRATWTAPIERDKADDVRKALSRRIRPFLLRRTKAAVAPELPDRTVIDVAVPLDPAERQLYEDVRRGALAELGSRDDEAAAQTRIRVLAALTALRRVACHPALHDPTWRGAASKLARVRELVSELRAEGHKALVFSQFVGHLHLVRAALEEDGVAVRYLDGSTPEANRRSEVDAFQRGEGDVFLISLKAGGTGLNLTAASYVLHLDPWWNPAVEDQATDRAHRIGQTRSVTVYRVVAAGTVEEQILRLHEDKRRLVAGVLEGTDAGAKLALGDLFALLRGEEPEAR